MTSKRTKHVVILVVDSKEEVSKEDVLALVDGINTDQRLAEEAYEETGLFFHLDSVYVGWDVNSLDNY